MQRKEGRRAAGQRRGQESQFIDAFRAYATGRLTQQGAYTRYQMTVAWRLDCGGCGQMADGTGYANKP